MLLGFLLYVPLAGSYGLWDPWETHYGEVARQMTSRGDYVSLWWPGSPLDVDAFWSKPVLSFWLMSLAMNIAGIGERGSPPGELAISSAAEWALRVPFCLMALLGLWGVTLVTARFVSKRAGALAGVALATMPLYGLVARQAMTDMAFVGPMTLALALAALALFTDDNDELPRRTWKRLEWSNHPLFYAVIALAAISTVPQLVVNSIQVTWAVPRTKIVIPGIVLMLPYWTGFIAFLYYAARTRFKAPLYLYLAAILCGLAILAKGLAGLGLPVIVLLAYLLFTWNWKRINRAQLLYGVLIALLACAIVAIPWHHAMLMRHGQPFWNELYGDNHWRRLVLGRHGDRGTFDYFLRELGYAVLPWIAVAPSALAWVVMRPFRAGANTTPRQPSDPGISVRQQIYWFGAIWFVACYTVVAMSMTKFHHYILPSLPGLAIAIGCFLDEVMTRKNGRTAIVAAFVGLPLLALVTHDLVSAQNGAQHFLWLFSYDYVNAPKGRPWPPDLNYVPALIVFAAMFGAATLAMGLPRLRRISVLGLGALGMCFTWFLLDVFMKEVSDRWSQKPLIATYYKTRRSHDERLIAWQMYWRGETFYTSNEIYQGPVADRTVFLGDRNAENLKAYLGRNSGRRVFFVVEKTRWETLRGLLPEHARPSLTVVDGRNNKFYLAVAEL
jgi:4-amino-4-deoxy-L-arabinose transferase-like glycosyltransferase